MSADDICHEPLHRRGVGDIDLMGRVPIRIGSCDDRRLDGATGKVGRRHRRTGLGKGLETRLPDATGSSNDERDPIV
jgi:hypothetical protein